MVTYHCEVPIRRASWSFVRLRSTQLSHCPRCEDTGNSQGIREAPAGTTFYRCMLGTFPCMSRSKLGTLPKEPFRNHCGIKLIPPGGFPDSDRWPVARVSRRTMARINLFLPCVASRQTGEYFEDEATQIMQIMWYEKTCEAP